MRASRGMGAVAPNKMPSGRTVERKDNPNKVQVFATGGKLPVAKKRTQGKKTI